MSTQYQLSAGFCKRLSDMPVEEADPLQGEMPILQVLSLKTMPGGQNTDGKQRHRLIMSDGQTFSQAMLACQLNHLIENNNIQKHTVVQLEKIQCQSVQNRRLVIILQITVLGHIDEKIGNPVQDSGATPSSSAPAAQSNGRAPAAASSSSNGQANANRRSSGGRQGTIFPIEGLSPYQNAWTIKARVTNKSEIKTWSNQRGEGKLFSVVLMDETSEIKATAFNAVADEMYQKFQEGKVYYVSKARVNLAKKKFSNLNNDYELSLERYTEVEECTDTDNLPEIKYNFVELSKLHEHPKDGVIDVIGVVKEVGDLGEITAKTTNRQISKRDLTLIDHSGYSCRLTLWGKQAEGFNQGEAPVIAFKGVKIGDFNGRTLSTISSSTMSVDPKIDESYSLQGWYDEVGKNMSFQSQSGGPGLSSSGSSFTPGGFNRSQVTTFMDMKARESMISDKPEYFSVRGTIMHIKSDSQLYYPACRTDGCSKKVTDNGDGWRCEKCDQSFEQPDYRYIISMAVSDYSGQAWLQGFNDVGDMIFGMSANDLNTIKERDDAEYRKVVEKTMSATYNFNCRAKEDSFNDTKRVRYGISRIFRLNYKEECNSMLDLIKGPWGIGSS